jgi:hypothetical protein
MATQQQPPTMSQEIDRISKEHPVANAEQRVSILKKNSILNKPPPPPQKLMLKNIGSGSPLSQVIFIYIYIFVIFVVQYYYF